MFADQTRGRPGRGGGRRSKLQHATLLHSTTHQIPPYSMYVPPPPVPLHAAAAAAAALPSPSSSPPPPPPASPPTLRRRNARTACMYSTYSTRRFSSSATGKQRRLQVRSNSAFQGRGTHTGEPSVLKTFHYYGPLPHCTSSTIPACLPCVVEPTEYVCTCTHLISSTCGRLPPCTTRVHSCAKLLHSTASSTASSVHKLLPLVITALCFWTPPPWRHGFTLVWVRVRERERVHVLPIYLKAGLVLVSQEFLPSFNMDWRGKGRSFLIHAANKTRGKNLLP
ncbi:hypothetical protein K504DRAFT_32655 [Pleomassaria siparia CBS 279.74]|uniref:Uncharacterized protein n=1 Tax=Pleomassaria siparia CBS 279.74 TaxID=1314801 RepID=A0A6G1KT20_9PLEO|nr:hypothetical protein K504DRAFT_32655 [Pleomassaria siparia CBS 279.74]